MEMKGRTDTLVHGCRDLSILKTLEQGSFATVYLARKTNVDATFVVKATNKSVAQGIFAQRSSRLTLQSEWLVQSQCHHPNIVEVLQSWDAPLHFCLLCEFVKYGDMMRYAMAEGKLASDKQVSFCSQMLSALQYLQQQGVAHRDVKPDNILLGRRDCTEFKLGDFGLATQATLNAGCQTMCGTLMYMAPEMLTESYHQRHYGQLVDVWACGVSFYMMFIGLAPYDCSDEQLKQYICRGAITWAGVMEEPSLPLLKLMLAFRVEDRLRVADLQLEGWSRWENVNVCLETCGMTKQFA